MHTHDTHQHNKNNHITHDNNAHEDHNHKTTHTVNIKHEHTKLCRTIIIHNS